MEFPTLVYRSPGEHTCQGGSFKSRQVTDEASLVVALADGWFKTLPDALAGKAEQSAPTSETAAQPPAARKTAKHGKAEQSAP